MCVDKRLRQLLNLAKMLLLVPTDGRTDGRTDRQTHPHFNIDMCIPIFFFNKIIILTLNENRPPPPDKYLLIFLYLLLYSNKPAVLRQAALDAERARRVDGYRLLRPRTDASIRNRYLSKVGANLPGHLGHGGLIVPAHLRT